jgi:hypothetical protein
MPDDPQFDKKDFENVVRNLLKSKPLPKKKLGTSKKAKMGSVLRSRPPKREK